MGIENQTATGVCRSYSGTKVSLPPDLGEERDGFKLIYKDCQEEKWVNVYSYNDNDNNSATLVWESNPCGRSFGDMYFILGYKRGDSEALKAVAKKLENLVTGNGSWLRILK